MKLDKILLGTQYFRPPTPLENEWDEDMKGISEIGLDTIQLRLSWRWYERIENQYDLSQIDRLINKAKETNKKIIIKFMLETAPQYIFDKYNGTRVKHDGSLIRGGAHGAFYGGWRPCFTNPKVLERAKKFVQFVVNRYKNEDSIVLYNVWNEIRNKPFDECFCSSCKKAYQDYLKEKFVSIDKYNDFFGAAEESFESIPLPSDPHGYYDLFEFKKWKSGVELARWLKVIYQAIKEIKPSIPVMAHVGIAACLQSNLEDMSNDFETSKAVDFFGTSVGCDSSMRNNDNRLSYLMLNDYMYSIDKNYFVHEIYPGLGMYKEGWYDKPFDLDFKLYSSLACGAKGEVFWQYRAERLGYENDCSGLVNMDGSKKELTSRVSCFANNLSRDIDYLSNAEPVKSDIGIVFDYDSMIISEIEDIQGPDFEFKPYNPIFYYKNAHEGLYKLLSNLKTNVSYVRSNDLESFNKYKTLFVPYGNMINDQTSDSLSEFVFNGGTLIVDEGFRLRDSNTWVNPYDLKVKGIKVRVNERRLFGNRKLILNNKEINVGPYVTTYKIQSDYKSLLKFNDGEDAIFELPYGKGKYIFLGFSIGAIYNQSKDPIIEDLVKQLVTLPTDNISSPKDGFYVKQCVGEGFKITFFLNASDQTKTFDLSDKLISLSSDLIQTEKTIQIPSNKCGYVIHK